jgi:hypothetical protein
MALEMITEGCIGRAPSQWPKLRPPTLTTAVFLISYWQIDAIRVVLGA